MIAGDLASALAVAVAGRVDMNSRLTTLIRGVIRGGTAEPHVYGQDGRPTGYFKMHELQIGGVRKRAASERSACVHTECRR